MKSTYKFILILVFGGLLASCSKDEDNTVPLRDYAVQYATDIEAIETFLKTHSINFNPVPGPNEMDVSFSDVAELDPASIWGTNSSTPNANLLQWPVEKDGITYIIYYLQLRQGSGPNSKSPCNYDGVLAAYKGWQLYDTDDAFETNNFPQSYFYLNGVIRGWSEIFPKFKTGSYTSGPDGTITYSDFGAGVMFIPSGLAYYASPPAGIDAYSPLIFSFKLFEVQRVDNDGDGIYTYQEDLNGDGYIRDNATTHEDDTDHDGAPDAFDLDDDADGVSTREEREYTVSGTTYFYSFDGAQVDDPATPDFNETHGIPNCSGDFFTPTRLRRHRDPGCH